MCNYAGTYKGICSYNLQCITFDIAFTITKFGSSGTLFKRTLAWDQGISKS